MKPDISGLFITGSDTGVGKTRVGAALARLLVERGVSLRPRKPVESGCLKVRDKLIPQDAWTLKQAADTPEPIEAICPYPFEPAIAPDRAAQLAGQSLTIADLAEVCTAGATETDFVLVEGAGGFCSPLASDGLNADLAVSLGLPVLVVVADRLGCISHALLTVEAIRRRGLTLAGIVLNQMTAILDPHMDNAADLTRWLGLPIHRVPYQEDRKARCELLPLIDEIRRMSATPQTE